MPEAMTWHGVDLRWAYSDLLKGIRRRTGCVHRAGDVLVLDEPTSALDLKNQGIVLEWIARLRDEGLTVLSPLIIRTTRTRWRTMPC